MKRFILALLILPFLTGCAITRKADRFEMKLDASSRGITANIVGVGITFYIVVEKQQEVKNENLSSKRNPITHRP